MLPVLDATVRKNWTAAGLSSMNKSERNRWRAQIRGDDKQINLGTFKTKEEAIAARKQGELKYWVDV